MVLKLNGNNVVIKSISEASSDIVKYIDERKSGVTQSLKTSWSRLNNLCNGGIEPNVLFTISGISGGGKSAIVNMLETDLIDLNPNQNIVILSFSLEMLSSRQIGRKISAKLKRTTSELYSSTSELSDHAFDRVKKITKDFNSYPIFYVEGPVNIKTVEETIAKFQEMHKDKWLIITFDHTLLVDGVNSENKANIDALQKVFMKAKKIDKTTIIQIAQLNRSIELSDRVKLPAMHYPMRSDLSSSDFMYQCSDYVAVLHRPELLGILSYGTQHLPVKDMIYLHLLKNREGELGIIPFKNELKYNTLTEYTRPEAETETVS